MKKFYRYMLFVVLLSADSIVCNTNIEDYNLFEITSSQDIQEFYQIMKDFHELCILHDIRYWVDFGTLVGAIRHQGFIPWDYDLDVAVDLEDEPKLLAIVPLIKSLGFDFFWQWSSWKMVRNNCRLDILIMNRVNDKYQYHNENHWGNVGMRNGRPNYHTLDELYPLKEYTFGPIKVMGPQNPIPFLDCYYGNDWQEFVKYKNSAGDYMSGKIKLTEELKKPALPAHPLKDNVTKERTAPHN